MEWFQDHLVDLYMEQVTNLLFMVGRDYLHGIVISMIIVGRYHVYQQN